MISAARREAVSETFDLVLDLRATPAFTQHALPQGYLRWDGQRRRSRCCKLRALVGEFEKPKFFAYKQKLCAHSRNEKVGCTACIDVCSASAISSEKQRQQIKVNPNLCVGCGACTTVCPTGATELCLPARQRAGRQAQDPAGHLRQAGGKDAALLLHSQEARHAPVGDLGRAAQLDTGDTRRAGARDAAGAVAHRVAPGWICGCRPLPMAPRRSGC